MTTLAATFTAKIRSLHEYHHRLVVGTQPQPSGLDIAKTLDSLNQELFKLLKGTSSIPISTLCSKNKDAVRLANFPSLDYTGILNAVVQLLDALHLVSTSQVPLGQSILHTLCWLVPFVEHELMDTLPYLAASCMATLPSACHKDIVAMLCYNLLPFTLCTSSSSTYCKLSVPSILMMVLLYAEDTTLQTQLLETLMQLKSDVAYDLICVIAHGTVKARCPAVELLFQYWPELNPSAADRKALNEKHSVWTSLPCQREDCANTISAEAVKMTVDLSIALTIKGEKAPQQQQSPPPPPPPLLLCIDCADLMYRSGRSRDTLYDLLLPLDPIPYECDSKKCTSQGSAKMAVVTCFSTECTNYNVNKPVRYCKACHEARHINQPSDPLMTKFTTNHVIHESIPSPWTMEAEKQAYLVEAIVSLLREAQPFQDKQGGSKEMGASMSASFARSGAMASGPSGPGLPTDESAENIALEERQLMSRYGIWLMTGLCTPTSETPEHVLGRLLAMLFNWFHCTACLPDDQAGSALERLKGECIHGWLMKVVETHFQVFVNCLVPYPVEYARVGGHWDCWPSQSNQIKEGFKRLLCLVPYDIITPKVWSYIMPYWMECFRNDVPEEELSELKILLSKVLDPDLSPLGFTTKQMYEFISIRLEDTSPPVIEQALSWIQILTLLEVPVPIKLLLTMLTSAMSSLSNRDKDTHQFKQLGRIVVDPALIQTATPPGKKSPHVKKNEDTDSACINSYILILDILVKQMELQEFPAHKGLENNDVKPVLELLRDTLRAPWPGVHTCEQIHLMPDMDSEEDFIQCNQCEVIAIWHQLSLILVEYFCPVVELTITDSSADAFTSTKPVEPKDENVPPDHLRTHWATTKGVFEFKLTDLPVHQQLLFVFLRELERTDDADILYHLLGSLKFMCLNAEVLEKAIKDPNSKGFLIWTQENLLVKNLWSLLQAEFSQISSLAVPLLLHTVTLPSGRNIFIQLVETAFSSKDPYVRFTAVERITTIAHFVDAGAVKNSPSLQASLAASFTYLVHCLDDIESSVAQRALLSLETIKTSSLRLLLWCLETQFDLVLVDRPMILQTVFQLYNHMSERRFLTWDFFLNRFDALFVEAQIAAGNEGTKTRDLKNTNVNSEIYKKKVARAQEALNHQHLARSLSGIPPPTKHAKSSKSFSRVVIPRASDKLSGANRRKSLKTSASNTVSTTQIPEKLQQFSGTPANANSPSGAGNANDNFQQKDLEAQIAEENHLLSVVHQASTDDSLHLLITLLMQFLSRPDQSHPSEQKALQKNQSIVLRHVNILLGYSQAESCFLIQPSHLRILPVFSAFLTALPKVLDFNLKMANILLPSVLPLLIYCPAPETLKGPAEPLSAEKLPNYSLWTLKSHIRQSWLTSVQIILYKYVYNKAPLADLIRILIQISMNTLEAHLHSCKTAVAMHVLTPSRSRDLSSSSVDLLIDPTGSTGGDSAPALLDAISSSAAETETTVTAAVVAAIAAAAGPVNGLSPKHEFGPARSIYPKTKAEKEGTPEDASSEGESDEGDVHLPASLSVASIVPTVAASVAGLEAIPESPRSDSIISETQMQITGAKKSSVSSIQSNAVFDKINEEGEVKAKEESKEALASKKSSDAGTGDAAASSQQPVVASVKVKSPTSPSGRPTLQRMGALDTGSIKIKSPAGTSEVQSSLGTHAASPISHISPTPPAPERLLPVGGEGGLGSRDPSPSYRNKDVPPSKERLLPIGPPPRVRSTIYPSVYSPISPPAASAASIEAQLLLLGPLPTNDPPPKPPRLHQLLEMEKQQKEQKVFTESPTEETTGPAVVNAAAAILEKEQQKNDQEKLQGKTDKCETKVKASASSEKASHATTTTTTTTATATTATTTSEVSQKSCDDSVTSGKNTATVAATPVTNKTSSNASASESTGGGKKKKKKSPGKGSQNASASSDSVVLSHSMSAPQSKQQSPKKSSIKLQSPPKGKKQLVHQPSSKGSASGLSKLDSLGQSVSLDLGLDMDLPVSSSVAGEKTGPRYKQKKQKGKLISQASTGGLGEGRSESSSTPSHFHRSLEGKSSLASGSAAAGIQRRAASKAATRSSLCSEAGSTKGVINRTSGYMYPSHYGCLEDGTVPFRCTECGCVMEEFTEDEIGSCIVILRTYVHREPELAAPILPQMLRLVARFASYQPNSWQAESNIHLQGNTCCIAKQFLRCTLHQLSTNGVFQQIFSSNFTDPSFLRSMALSLADFSEINQVSPLIILFEDLNGRKHLPHLPNLLHICNNVACYLECLGLDSSSASGTGISTATSLLGQNPWSAFFPLFDNFLKNLSLVLPPASSSPSGSGSATLAGVLTGTANTSFTSYDTGKLHSTGDTSTSSAVNLAGHSLSPVLRIMLATLRIPIFSSHRGILESYARVLAQSLQLAPFPYELLLELCAAAYRAFTKERDKLILARSLAAELVHSVKVKCIIPDQTLMTLIQLFLQDVSGSLIPSVVSAHLKMNTRSDIECFVTGASEGLKNYLQDLLDFIADIHASRRIKSNFSGTHVTLNEDTLGGHLKAGLAQWLSLEITKGYGRDHRAVTKFLPWLYSLPSVQNGPKEFLDSVSHVRILSWLLLSSLQHSALLHNTNQFSLCQPVPLEANVHIAEHIQVILAGFAEQSKASVIHMSSLFYAFILCQLWTMYCENICSQNPPGGEQAIQAVLVLSDFWAKITPGILQLICHSKGLAEIVSLHFLSLMEALMDCNSFLLARMLPLWIPVFVAKQSQLSSALRVRLQACIDWQPSPQQLDPSTISAATAPSSGSSYSHASTAGANGNTPPTGSGAMLSWLYKVQFKMTQVELQSSEATQFYTL